MISRILPILLFCFVTEIACAQSETYLAIKDSILHAPKMQHRLRNDSIQQSEVYYSRKNDVRMQIESRDDEAAIDNDTTWLNVWGAQELEVHRFGEKFMYRRATKYDEFGNIAEIRTEEYYRDVLDGVSVDLYSYAVLPGGMREVLTQFIRRDSNFTEGVFYKSDSVFIVYEYDRNYLLVGETRTGTHSDCSEGHRTYIRTTAYTYNNSGKIVQYTSFTGGSCKPGVTRTCDLVYDENGRLVEEIEKEGGNIIERSSYTRTLTGRVASYYNNEHNSPSIYRSSHTYFKNGLLYSDEVEYQDKTSLHMYTYIYYIEKKRSWR